MTPLLAKPWKVDESGERLYVYAPGEVCVDIISGTPEDRRRVLALLAQVQEMALALKPLANTQCEGPADCGWHRGGDCPTCRARAVLREAGVMSGPHARVEGP